MSEMLKRILSHDSGPFWQFVKYGVVGVVSTGVQVCVFYLLATTCLACLSADDWAVRLLGFPAVDVSDGVRSLRFAVATGVGFMLANIFCWLMSRWLVFRAGKFRWFVEFCLFFGLAAFATLIALAVSGLLIRWAGLMTTIAVFVEVAVSFLLNFFVRKFVIFRG